MERRGNKIIKVQNNNLNTGLDNFYPLIVATIN